MGGGGGALVEGSAHEPQGGSRPAAVAGSALGGLCDPPGGVTDLSCCRKRNKPTKTPPFIFIPLSFSLSLSPTLSLYIYMYISFSLPLGRRGYRDSYSCLVHDTYQVGGCGDAEGTRRLQSPRGLESGVERDEGRVLCGRVVEAWPSLPVRGHDVRLGGRDRDLLGLSLPGLQA